jgi:hypothetical protein
VEIFYNLVKLYVCFLVVYNKFRDMFGLLEVLICSRDSMCFLLNYLRTRLVGYMYRKIKYSESEAHCRYLSLGVNLKNNTKMCNGLFYSFINKEIGLKKLPYNIQLVDLVLDGCLTSDLFVELPKEYFIGWKDYPIIGLGANENDDNELIHSAGYCSIHFGNATYHEKEELIHPYDSVLQLKSKFVDAFSVPQKSSLQEEKHPNGRFFFPNEIYLSYWKSYVVLEALESCKFIDDYISNDSGIVKFKEHFSRINTFWNEKYNFIFDAISHFRTFTSLLHSKDTQIKDYNGEIGCYLLNVANVDKDDLHRGMELLLELHKTWCGKIKRSARYEYNNAINSLKRDIFFLFEWLCWLGCDQVNLINKWSIHDRQPRSWSEIGSVLPFESIKLRKNFNQFFPRYFERKSGICKVENADALYTELALNTAFEPWVRAFSDLHDEINTKDNIVLNHPRILENLLVMTIRTEVLIRQMFKNKLFEEERDLKNLFSSLAETSKFDSSRKIFNGVVSNFKETVLNAKPENIFDNINKLILNAKRPHKENQIVFIEILRFVTARNYFAHHYYLDEEFDFHTNDICGEVFKSCLHTVLFVYTTLNETD